jgi:hypothetical protein
MESSEMDAQLTRQRDRAADKKNSDINAWQRHVRVSWCRDRWAAWISDAATFEDLEDIVREQAKISQSALDISCLLQIASLARVPSHRLVRLYAGVHLELEREWKWHKQVSTFADREARRSARRQLAKLKRMSAELSTSLLGLSSVAVDDLDFSAIFLSSTRSVFKESPPTQSIHDFDQIKKRGCCARGTRSKGGSFWL